MVAGAELVANLPDFRPVEAETGEGGKHEGCGLVVALPDPAPGILRPGRTDDGEAQRTRAGCGRAPARAPDEDRVSFLVRGPDCILEAGPTGVTLRHPDVEGCGGDGDDRGPLAGGDALEDRSLVGVGHTGVFEPFWRQQVQRIHPLFRIVGTALSSC